MVSQDFDANSENIVLQSTIAPSTSQGTWWRNWKS